MQESNNNTSIASLLLIVNDKSITRNEGFSFPVVVDRNVEKHTIPYDGTVRYFYRYFYFLSARKELATVFLTLTERINPLKWLNTPEHRLDEVRLVERKHQRGLPGHNPLCL
jgi:hypothetical protein